MKIMKIMKMITPVLLIVFIVVFSMNVKAADNSAYGSLEGFTKTGEMPANSIFVQLNWPDAKVYSYTPSEVYDNITSMMQCMIVYTDKPLNTMDEAWKKLTETGLIDVAEKNHAIVFFVNPVNGTSFEANDYNQTLNLVKALAGKTLTGITYSFPYAKFNPNKVYMIGEGQGADFISQYLTNDIFSSMISANVLINGTKVPEKKNYAIPAMLINCDAKVVDFYKEINEANAVSTVDATAEGMTVFYNSKYVMDSGYTPKRVIVSNEKITELSKNTANTAWNVLLKRVWNDVLEKSYFTEGVQAGYVQDRPIVDELGLKFNMINGKEAEGTGQSRWYEWVPNEVYDTIKNGTNETYPLIVVNHGNGDHPIYEAESNGWVQLAGEERVIVVAMQDIFKLGMPPESADTRYGKSNAEFIKNVICKKYPVDMSRIYISGFSIGAFVTAETSSAAPELFAAAAPLAYPGDGYMQIFPYEENGVDSAQYDLPVMYLCGRADGGNTMKNPQDTNSSVKVMSTQLFLNQILTFNEMNESKVNLLDYDYDWFPGKNDYSTKNPTGGYTIDGVYYPTYVSYVTKNLDFSKYPFYGFDPTSLKNLVQDFKTTGEGIYYDRNIIYNNESMPMVEFLVMGDMGHNHYGRYARMVWDDMFSHYQRDPETGILSYNGVESTKIISPVTAAKKSAQNAQIAKTEAVVAQQKAEEAKKEAMAAQQKAEEAKKEAVVAQQKAIAAQKAAEAAKAEAIKAQAEAKAAAKAVASAQAKVEKLLVSAQLKAQTPSITTIKSTKAKTVQIAWKVLKGVEGYEIQYATKASFSNKKTITVKSASTQIKTVTKLTRGKTYYVRVRAYKTVNGTKLYTKFSTIKKVKVK